jgi:uncharacterized membrane protein
MGAGPATRRDEAASHTMDAVERTVSRVLIVGIAVSVVLMAIGIVLSALDSVGMPRGVTPLAQLPAGLAALEPGAYLSLGLITLIATPFVRVGGSIIAFAREHDRRYVLITAVVFTVMCLSVLVGRA